MANTTFGNVLLGVVPVLIVPASPDRKAVIIHNISQRDVFIGPDATITTLNAIFLGSGEKFVVGNFNERWNGDIFGVVSVGIADVRFWEWGQ